MEKENNLPEKKEVSRTVVTAFQVVSQALDSATLQRKTHRQVDAALVVLAEELGLREKQNPVQPT